jgi:Circadian oscillating protein COP23
MDRLFRSIAITLFLPILIGSAPALASDRTVKVRFFCAPSQDDKMTPTTYAMTSGMKDYLPLIMWKYTPPKGTTNQQRCESTSSRFQSAWDRGTFDKLIANTDKKNGAGLICAVSYRELKCDRSNSLFTLNTGSDAADIIQRLRGAISGPEKGEPIPQSSDPGTSFVDIALLISKLK